MRHAAVLTLLALLALVAPAAARPATTPLPGSVGLTQKVVPLRHACEPTFRSVKRVKPGDAAAFVAAMTHPRIAGLDFDPARPARARESTKRFQAWLDRLTRRFGDARRVQEQIFLDASAPPQAKVEAAARMVLLQDQAALLIATAEIPVNVRALPEAADVFCETLHEQAEPLRTAAEGARRACGKLIVDAGVPAGWWTPICQPALPPPPAPPAP